jgi:hypothetical protein
VVHISFTFSAVSSNAVGGSAAALLAVSGAATYETFVGEVSAVAIVGDGAGDFSLP